MKVAVLGSMELHIAAHRQSIDHGCTLIPLSLRAPDAAIRQALLDSGAEILASDDPRVALLAGDLPVQATVDGLTGDGAIRVLLQTSGTTGAPAWIPITRTMLEAHRPAAMERLGADSESVWLAVLPPHHIGGVALLDRCLYGGGTLHTLDRFTVETFQDALPGATHVSLVPTMLRRLLDAGVRPPASLRCALVGGDRIDENLTRRALDAGWPMFATYGLTEACSQVSTATPQERALDPATAGRPLRGVEVSILEPDKEGWGIIEVAGPTVAGGRHRTSDIGRMTEGRLTVRGRAMERIVTGGETVDARAIEAVLELHPGVVAACVVGLPDAEWGQRVAAAVEGDVHADELLAWCKERLSAPEVPRLVDVWDALPRSETGKLQRGTVLARFRAQSTTPT